LPTLGAGAVCLARLSTESPARLGRTCRDQVFGPAEIVREVQRRRGDGRVIALVNQPMEGGGWVATHEDITERRQAERDRDRTKAFLDTVIENVPVTLVVKDAQDHRYVLVNRAAEELTGLTRGEVIGKKAHRRQLDPNKLSPRPRAVDSEMGQNKIAKGATLCGMVGQIAAFPSGSLPHGQHSHPPVQREQDCTDTAE
jgi:PAS domain-containing protein